MPLLTLPRELRDHIWDLVFYDKTVTAFPTNNRDWFFFAARRQCHACPASNDLPSTKAIFDPLLTCKQIYNEAFSAFCSSLHLNVGKAAELESLRLSPQKRLHNSLRYLKVTVHLTDSSREQWARELRNIPNTFPNLTQLEIHNHMRPPVCFQNLSDAIYLAGPIVQYPPTLKPHLEFDYIEDDEMFSSEEHGTIYYRDALEAHEEVHRLLIADAEFKVYARSSSFDPMINRLMLIAQSREEKWLDSIRERRRSQRENNADTGAQNTTRA